MNIEKSFNTSEKKHVLMITNHGIHQWKIIPGLPDTGGQNVFVNQFSDTLAQLGFRITIANRGGYPHPITGEARKGFHYKDENQRILYLEDGQLAFVRKEDMDERLPYLARALYEVLGSRDQHVDLIISHYWDGAKLGMLFNQELNEAVKHIWVPHSLGSVKKRNMDKREWENLKLDERIAVEKEIIKEVDGIAATSSIIKESLKNDYDYSSAPLFLPPCVDVQRYYPRSIGDEHPVWSFLAEHAGITQNEVRSSRIITEISRTDATKRKDILIKAFADVHQHNPDTLLVLTIDLTNKLLAEELTALIQKFGIEKRVVILGSVWDELPDIYAVTDIYCTPSVMEGFGMTSQEAAATKVPVVSSHLVPYVAEYLLGEQVEEILLKGGSRLQIGEGAIVVPADDVAAFAAALEKLLADKELRRRMGKNAYKLTIPYFTWENMVKLFLRSSGIKKEK